MSKLTVVNRGLRLGIRQSLRISRLKTEVLVSTWKEIINFAVPQMRNEDWLELMLQM